MRTPLQLQVVALTALAAVLATGLILAGCGTPGAPQPPSLNLPAPVDDLTATRAGNQVALTWTMPKKNTDKLLLKGNIAVYICHQEGTSGCEAAGADLSLAPGAAGAFTDTLPAQLVSGLPRPLTYFVVLKNRNGRSADLSNAAVVLAGVAPQPVDGLSAELRKQGVVLRWANSAAPDSSAIRLHRKLLTPPAAKPHDGLFAPLPEPVEQNLLVESAARGQVLDKNIRFGESYEYLAQRIARVIVKNQTLELAGPLSNPVRIDAQDIFPPEVPTSLAAVATTSNIAPFFAIDLSWQPSPDANLAGYIVYRREGDSPWQRISPAQPLIPPVFHDTQLQPGHTYSYAVSAIGQNGHESPRSADTEETVPNP
jgi:hypothetical protein